LHLLLHLLPHVLLHPLHLLQLLPLQSLLLAISAWPPAAAERPSLRA
jgi:hypothetical protein